MPRRNWFIVTSDPESATFLASPTANIRASARFPRNATDSVRIHLLEEKNLPGQLYKELSLADYESLAVSVGLIDKPPTSGTFKLSVNGNATGLTALAYNISAADLQTAISAIVPVTVVKVGSQLFRVTVTATNTAITWTSDATALQPESTITISTRTAPAVGVSAVYNIELLQSPYGFSNVFTPRDTSGDGVAISTISAGGTEARARYQVAITDDPGPIGGGFRLLYSEKQVAKISCQENSAVAQVWNVLPIANSSNNLDGDYFDLCDGDGPVRVVLGTNTPSVSPNPIGTITAVNTGTEVLTLSASVTAGKAYEFSGTPPTGISTKAVYYALSTGTTSAFSTTVGGSAVNVTTSTTGATIHLSRRIAVALPASEMTVEEVSTAIADALNQDAAFLNGVRIEPGGNVVITAATGGVRSLASSGTSGFTVTVATYGSAGQLAGKGFVLDDYQGTVGVYATVAGLPSTAPDFAAACTRQIAVALTGGESASAVATAMASPVNSDAEFVASATGNVITCTDAKAGARANSTTASAGYFGVTIAVAGAAIVATVNHDSTADAFEAQLGGLWTVTKTDSFKWVLTYLAVGSPTAPTVENSNLRFLIGLEGELAFDTEAMHAAHADSDADELDAKLEVKGSFTGDATPRLLLQIPCTSPADMQNGTISPGPVYGVTDSRAFKRGVATVTAGNDTVTVVFPSAFATAPSQVQTGALMKASSGDDDPPVVMAIHTITTTGFTAVLAGVPTDNASMPWTAWR